MSIDDPPSGSFSLRRWSRRKLAAARSAAETDHPPATASTPEDASASTPPPSANAARPAAEASAEPVALPPIESLTIDSDFTAFLQPRVAESVKRQALKQLFRDPRFNVMDGLDVYIDDYSLPDPISPEVVRGLMQARYVFDPPRTRVNEQGSVEDVPAADAAAVPDAPGSAALPGASESGTLPDAAAAAAAPSTGPGPAAPTAAAPVGPPAAAIAAPPVDAATVRPEPPDPAPR